MILPRLVDHLLAALVAVVYPLYATVNWYRRSRSQLETGDSRTRRRAYFENMIELWLLTTAVLCGWIWSGRSAAAVGLGLPGGWAFWIGALVFLASAAFLGRQVGAVRASTEMQEQVRRQLLGSTALMVPRNHRERWTWIGLSLTAGFCEEILYRGFLIWYLMTWLPAAVAVAVAAIVFGVAHLYLGWGGILRATAMGGFLGVVYLLTGSLWVPIALHAMVDITSGLTGSAALASPSIVEASGRSDP